MRDTPTKSPAFSPAQVRFTAHQVRETANKHIHGATKRMLLMLADMIETQEARAFVSNNVGIQRLAEDFKAEAKESGRREVLDEISKCFHSEDGDFVDSSTIRARLERLLRAQHGRIAAECRRDRLSAARRREAGGIVRRAGVASRG